MRSLIIAVLGLTAPACIPGNSPVRITGTFAIDEKCDVIDDPQLIRGKLDLAGSGQYRLMMQIDSELSVPTNKNQTGVELVSPGANNWIVDEILLSYTSKDPVIPSFKAERIALYGVIKPGTFQFLGANIITDDALQKMRDAISAGMTPATTVNVRIELKGHLESSTTVLGSVNTNPIIFPLTVTNSGTMCTGATVPTCPPGGQDGTPIMCCSGPQFPVGCP